MTGTRFGLSETVLDKICSVLSRHPEVEQAILYGSRAKGNFKRGSDIDLTLLGPSLSEQLLLRLMAELDDLLLPYTIDLSIHAAITHPDLREHIKRVGKVFYPKPPDAAAN
jgi:predicted nucleotidyltransferase